VAISIDPSAPGSPFEKDGAWSGLDPSFMSECEDVLKDTQGYESERAWWQKWKGTAASLLGIAAGAATVAFSLQATAKGFYFRYEGTAFGAPQMFEYGSFAAKFSSLMTAAGEGIAVGLAAGVAIYFIPWDRFFGWLGGVFAKICEACKRIWSWFTSWFAQFKEWLKKKFPKLRGPMASRV
jgi:hypothetical protein